MNRMNSLEVIWKTFHQNRITWINTQASPGKAKAYKQVFSFKFCEIFKNTFFT